jgi:D-proline reductase (dithiol) PrdB
MAEKPVLEMSRYCVPFTPFRGKLETSCICLVSTAGAHHVSDPPFDVNGDLSYRVIPGAARASELRIADVHYDHGCVDKDVNCVFPIDRLVELVREERLGGVTERHFSLGFTQALRQLRDETMPYLVEEVRRTRPDAALLTGG